VDGVVIDNSEHTSVRARVVFAWALYPTQEAQS